MNLYRCVVRLGLPFVSPMLRTVLVRADDPDEACAMAATEARERWPGLRVRGILRAIEDAGPETVPFRRRIA